MDNFQGTNGIYQVRQHHQGITETDCGWRHLNGPT